VLLDKERNGGNQFQDNTAWIGTRITEETLPFSLFSQRAAKDAGTEVFTIKFKFTFLKLIFLTFLSKYNVYFSSIYSFRFGRCM
jgi:hypothetical protein